MQRSKKYQLGKRVVTVQGYEPRALDLLLKTYNARKIEVSTEGSVPVIEYKLKGKTHKHYPDIFIPSENQVLEVKSTYTGMGNAATWKRNQTKALAAVEQGYRYSILLFDRNSSRIKLPRGWVFMSFVQITRWLKQYREGA